MRLLPLALAALTLTPLLPMAEAQTVRIVPDQYPTIQAAVTAADPGDTILIRAGTYHESVTVPPSKRDLTLQGSGMWDTLLVGDGQRDWAIVVRADGVAVRDLGARDYTGNGIFFEDVDGFLMERLTAGNTGEYGLYAIRSSHGAVRDSVAWGHNDAGIYVGESLYCFCVVERNRAFDNVNGYSGTASNYITIRDNDFHDNRIGLSLSTLPSEPGFQQYATVVGNRIHHNNNHVRQGTLQGVFFYPTGIGIAVAGGSHDAIVGNDVHDNELWGISMFWLEAAPVENRVTDNVLADNGVDLWWDEYGVNNCWERNRFRSSDPAVLPDCSSTRVAGAGNVGVPNPRKTLFLVLLATLQEGEAGDPYHTPLGDVGPLPI